MQDTRYLRNIQTPETWTEFAMRLCVTLGNQQGAFHMKFEHFKTVIGVLKCDLKAFPCKIQLMQKLTSDDEHRCYEFCAWFNGIIDQAVINIDDIFQWQCHVYSNSMVNKQNCRFWGMDKPAHFVELPLHSTQIIIFWMQHKAAG